jgi:SWI/SNF-related matrix-associated actin-dependent regulator 1 of chromatin subfamily A
MLLDYNPATKAFLLRVNRAEANVREIVEQHGLDISLPASSSQEAVLFTRQPYAAAAFGSYATPGAANELREILDAVAQSWSPASDMVIAQPADRELWSFQRADVAYALGRRNTLVGDQPGLGKTPVAICFANEIKAKRVLVVCPANIRLQWAKRIREWSTMKGRYTVYPILKSSHGVYPDAEWTVVSYDLARTEAIGKALAAQRYDLLVLDEVRYLKEDDTNRARAVFGGGDVSLFTPLAERCDRILALDGTPLPNRPAEIYTVARSLCFDAIDFMSKEKFRDRFNPSLRFQVEAKDADGHIIKDSAGRPVMKWVTDERSGRHWELQNRLRANFMVRHLKSEVMSQLHLPAFDVIDLEETAEIREALHAESLLHIDFEDLKGIDYINGHIGAVRCMMGIACAPQVADYAKLVLDSGEDKLTIFAWHIKVLDILQQKLEKFGVLRIDGSTTASQKQRFTDEFRANPDKRVMLGNMLSLGSGTDGLQDVCQRGIIAEPDWVFGNNQQCSDRLVRGGQKGKVLIDICAPAKSIAAKILAHALDHGHTINKALDARI